MIRIGLSSNDKMAIVERYGRVSKVVWLSSHIDIPAGFSRATSPDDAFDRWRFVVWEDIQSYRFFYRLMQDIDASTLVVLNECLRTQNRHDLTYNCIRNFLQQTNHQIVFQRLPIIDTLDDMAILVDFDTRSRWKREPFNRSWVADLDIQITDLSPSFRPTVSEATPDQHKAYQKARDEAFAKLGHGDPHTLPRSLHVAAGKTRMAAVSSDKLYVARNGRVKLPNFATYEHAKEPRVVFDFCHRFIDFSDFLATTGQRDVECVVSDLPVDQWYLKRYTDWARRVGDACSALHG